MKTYTDLEQSKKLAEILPLESADMAWCNNSIKGINYTDKYSANLYTVKEMKDAFDKALAGWDKYWELIPCWSLDALLEVMPQSITKYIESERCQKTFRLNLFRSYYHCCSYCTKPSVSDDDCDDTLYCFGRDNWVDACYEMILKLNELKLL